MTTLATRRGYRGKVNRSLCRKKTVRKYSFKTILLPPLIIKSTAVALYFGIFANK